MYFFNLTLLIVDDYLNLFRWTTRNLGNFAIVIFFSAGYDFLQFMHLYSSLIISSSKNLVKQS